MIVGIGTDLLDARRMRRLHARFGKRLAERLLHEAEWPGFRATRDPAHYLARCFAVKEAAAKAMGTGFHGLAHTDVGSVRNALGKPGLVFSPHGLALLEGLGVGRSHVSLSDEGEMILAFVVLEAGIPAY
jgi:holo-[acyl-carrier protein] synthase